MRHRFRNRLASVLTLVFAGAIATSAQTPPARPLHPPSDGATNIKRWRALTTVTEHGVRVDLALDRDPTGRVWLAATYTPTEPGAHLYSKDLPANGIDGLGRPTLLALVAPSALTPTGALVADRPVESDRIDVLNLTFPVYPAGPVTLRMPVDLPPAGSATRAEVSISYMACGPKGCLPPVENKHVTIDVR
jgi:hypothetical protein